MRQPTFRGYYIDPSELVVDSFAGGGGASTGIEAALERPVDLAINHDPEAIAMHAANHPGAKHFIENIWEVDPKLACGSRPVGLAWFSPDCTHFSRAKGSKPLSKDIRGLAWVVVRWAREVAPRVICVENVEEFQTWGPLDDMTSRPDPTRVGETFREWCAELTGLGYQLEFKLLVAADYGAPTTRKRLFMVARRDGAPIIWPEASHGPAQALPWRPAAEVIDWSIPCPSIFERKRPLAEATLRRIAAGIRRYVVEAPNPFIVPVTHHKSPNRVHGIDEPLRTVTAANRGELALIEPFVVRHGHYSTITGAGLDYIKGGPGTFRGQSLEDPLSTVCATNDRHIVVPLVTKHYGRQVGHGMQKTLGTVTGRDHHALTAAMLTKFHGGEEAHQALRGQSLEEPIRTVDTSNRFGLAAAFMTKFYGTSKDGVPMTVPMPTVTAGGKRGGGHIAQVRAFLLKYYSANGKARHGAVGADEPLHTVTSKARFGIVTIEGEQYRIIDIGMRMLQPRELFRAQGFPDDYQIAPQFNGKPLTKTAQIAKAGNSVCPQVAQAIVSAQISSR